MKTDTDRMTIVEAVTTRGVPLTLVTDPDGDFFLVEQLYFQGGVPLIVAHKIGPGDKLVPGVTRYAILQGCVEAV